MTNLIIDCETTGKSPVVKRQGFLGEVIREHNRLLSISILNLDKSESQSFYGEDEKEFLSKFFEYIDDTISYGDKIIGFNLEFDINFIRVRAFFHNLKIPFHFLHCDKIDLRKIINSEEYSVGTLGFWGEVCGMKAKTDNGSKMPELYAIGDWETIKGHSEEDCIITKKIYERCKEIGLI